MNTTTAAPVNVSKADLAARKRGKGGTLVRVAPSALDALYARELEHAFTARFAERYPDETVFVVKDLMDRKRCNFPSRVGVGPLDRGIGFGVELADIIEIVEA